MRELGVKGLTTDAQAILVHDPATDTQFQVPINGDLIDMVTQNAVQSVAPIKSTGSERIMDAILTPREIQSRIRGGQSPTEIAEETSMSLGQIEAFAGPVLAEREYAAQQARQSPVRRKHLSGSGEPLQELVEAGLRNHDADPRLAIWDAAKQNDGLWKVTVTVDGIEPCRFVFDAASRFVRPVDEPAHELIGDVPLPASADMALAEVLRATDHNVEDTDPATDADSQQQHTARSTAAIENSDEIDRAISDELELDLDLPQEVSALASAGERTAGVANGPGQQFDLPVVSSLKDARDRRAQAALAQQHISDHGARSDHDPARRGRHSATADLPEPDHTQMPHDSENDAPKKRHERRRVPSWDEIMFGGKEN